MLLAAKNFAQATNCSKLAQGTQTVPNFGQVSDRVLARLATTLYLGIGVAPSFSVGRKLAISVVIASLQPHAASIITNPGIYDVLV